MFDPSHIPSQILRTSPGVSLPSLKPQGLEDNAAFKEPCLEPVSSADHVPPLSSAGSAQKSMDFLDQIVNPWAAPSFEEVLNGEPIVPFREGEAVLKIQQRLIQLGYPLESTQVMDKPTLTAVQSLHEAEGIPFDNAFDMGSVKALERTEKKQEAIEHLKALKSKDLHTLARRSPEAFFDALMPAAIESERRFGVPAAITLAQASLESDWAAKPIGGFNIFGIKGNGPGGSVMRETREVVQGKDVYIKDSFARFNNYYEAVSEHGKHYNNGKYDRALNDFAQDGDAEHFVDTIAPTYATDPNYAWAIKKRFKDYNLLEMVHKAKHPSSE